MTPHMHPAVADETADATSGQSVRSPGPVAFLAVALGFFLAALDATVVNVAGAPIADDLDLSMSSLTWAVDGYMSPVTVHNLPGQNT